MSVAAICSARRSRSARRRADVSPQTRAAQPGDPLPGITPVEFEEFRLGLDDFLEVETAEEGLGPAFNGTSCARLSQRAGRRRRRRHRGAARRPRERADGEFADAGRVRRNAVSSVLGSRPRVPADRSGRRQRVRAAGADSAVRRRAGRSDPRRHALALEDPIDRERRRRQRPCRRRHRSSPPASGASAASAGRRSTRRC